MHITSRGKLLVSTLATWGIALALAACGDNGASLPLQPDPATLRSTAQGEIIGTRGRDGAQAWYGIPFAEAPVGELRWRAPRPAKTREGRFSALDFTHQCLQFAGMFASGVSGDTLLGSGGCLYLNIWAPARAQPDAALPVMFWIHGGGNTSGYAGQYELGRLAQSQGVVVVSVNYRLGPMGWLAHSALRATAQQPLDSTANFGTLDLIAALDWTADNIAAFGGNPQNITIWGESAGGVNVATLLGAPMARGKFHKAIIQSGAFSVHTLQEAEYGPAREADRRGHAAREAVARMAADRSVDTTAMPEAELARWLRAQAPATVFDAFAALNDKTDAFDGIDNIDVTADSVVIPGEGIDALLDDPARYNAVPLLLGTNRDEVRILGMFDESMTGKLWWLASWPKDPAFYRLHGAVLSDIWRASAVDGAAARMVAGGHAAVYSYRFDWDEQGSTLGNDMSVLMGAMHALEIPFVTGGFDDPVNDPFGVNFSEENRAGREALSRKMMAYWAAFARTGDPGRGDGRLPEWKSWSPDADAPRAMVFDTDAGGGVRMTADRLTVSGVLDRLATNPAAGDAQGRCKIASKARELFVFVASEIDPYITGFCGDSAETD
jgi:para-nitrobenzyl esterase